LNAEDQNVKITERIDALADRIEAHKFLTLHDVKSQPGLSAAKIAALEHDAGVTLSPSVSDLYADANGFLLHWTMRADLRGVTRAVGKGVEYELNPKRANLEYPDAIIQFLPLEEMLGFDWSPQFFPDDQSTYEYRGERLDQSQLRAQLRPFDECGLFCAAAFCDASFERVILVTDSMTNWNDSVIVRFEEYLDFVFHSAGVLEARMDLFVRGSTLLNGDLEFVHDE
jgi:hypothetical protein